MTDDEHQVNEDVPMLVTGIDWTTGDVHIESQGGSQLDTTLTVMTVSVRSVYPPVVEAELTFMIEPRTGIEWLAQGIASCGIAIAEAGA